MITRPESWSPRADGRAALAAAALGVTVFAFGWALLHAGPFDDYQIVDTPVYQEYGEAIAAGEVPYRDFALEYPPGALPVFFLPTLGSPGDYAALFEALMLTLGLASVMCVAVALTVLGASPRRLYGAAALAGASPVLLGTVVLTRYDLWPAALTVGALAALLGGRHRLGTAVLALAVAAKVYPLVLLPLALAYVARRRGTREALVALAVFACVLAAAFVPFLALAPDGLLASFERQTGRPLQIESLGAAFLLAAHQLGLYEAAVTSSHGSQNLAGSLADTIATAQTMVQALAILAVWVIFARGRADGERFVAASAAAVTAFVALGKVLSPQFLIWLVPLVPLVGGGVGAVAGGLFAAALVITHVWFPFRYWDGVALEPAGWLVLVRDLALVALFAVLVSATRRRLGSLRTP